MDTPLLWPRLGERPGLVRSLVRSALSRDSRYSGVTSLDTYSPAPPKPKLAPSRKSLLLCHAVRL